MNKWTREWGAVAFVATVVIGALAVGVSLLFSSGVSSGGGPTLPPCPTIAKTTPAAKAATSPTPTSTPTAAASPSESFNAIFANCPTATAPPGTPTATPASGSTPVPTPTPVPTATPYHPTPLS